MTTIAISPPYPSWRDVDGKPLEDGYIYIGTPNLDPITNPVSVYWDEALTVPAAQPIRTVAGYASNSGTPGQLYTSSDYSIQVQDKHAEIVYYAQSATQVLTGDSDDVTYQADLTGSVERTLTDRLQEHVSVLDFSGVDPTGVADSTSGIQAAIDAIDATTYGGTVLVPNGDYLIRGTLFLPRDVNLIGESANNTRFFQDDNSFGNILCCTAEGGTSSAHDCPQSRIANVTFDGNTSGFITLEGTVTSASASVTVTDTSELFAGMLIEANGVDEGTTIQSVDTGTTLTMSANANATVSNKNVGFRVAYSRTVNTILDSADVTISDATDLEVGMLIESANIQPYSYIEAIAGTTLTLNRTASATASSTAATVQVYNCGLFVEDDDNADSYNSSKYYRGPLADNVNVRQMSGDGFSIRNRRIQFRFNRCFGTNNRGHGCNWTGCSDATISVCGFGGNWKSGMTVTSSATPRIISTECWQTFRNDIYYEFRSQSCQQLTFAYGEINGSAYVRRKNSDPHNVLFNGVNFKFTSKNLRYTDGVREAYIYNDDTNGVVVIGCYFLEEDSGEKPEYLVYTDGASASTQIVGQIFNANAYNTDLCNNNARITWLADLGSGTVMQGRASFNRYGTTGKLLALSYDGTQVGAVNVFTDRPTITGNQSGAGVQIGDMTWDSDPLRMGGNFLWKDASTYADPIIRASFSSAPSSLADGEHIGPPIHTTFTPVLSDGTNTATHDVQEGDAVKIGPIVFVQIRMTISSKGSLSGSLRITGLPYDVMAGKYSGSLVAGFVSDANLTAGTSVVGLTSQNTDYFLLMVFDAVGGSTTLLDSEITDTFHIRISGQYLTSD